MAINLADISTRAPEKMDKSETKEKLASMLEELDELQNLLYASSKYSVLVVLQGMDASGKDGAIKTVFGALNPQGVNVKPYKAPTSEELSHDFLWRIHQHAPAKGMIQVFNRSHYEDILVTRVNKWCDDKTAFARMEAINQFEDLLVNHNNTQILKFYLHISPQEQKERFEERLTIPRKHWKFNKNDLKVSAEWDEYRNMYHDCFEHCNKVPWTVVPADQNWYKEYVIAKALYETLKNLDMDYPKISLD